MKRSQFGKNLRYIRSQFGLDARQLAIGLGLGEHGRQVISNWENGRREPSLHMLCTISDFFGVSTDLLLRDNNHDHPEVEKTYTLLLHNAEKVSNEDMKKLNAIISVFLDKPMTQP